MPLFGRGKSLVEQAEDERAKVQKKEMQLRAQQLDRQMIQERRRRVEELRRLQA